MGKEYEKRLQELKGYVRNIEYLKYTLNSLVYWDKITVMPPKAIHYRSEVMAYLGGELYRLFSSAALHECVDYIGQAREASAVDMAMVRRIKRNYIYVNQIPEKEYSNYISLVAKAEQVWETAKEQDDFSAFAPHLKRIVATFRSFAEYWGYEDDPYDALIGYYEEGAAVSVIDRVAEELKAFILPLLKRIREQQVEIVETPFLGQFSKAQQQEMTEELLKVIGFDFAAGRLDESSHPTTLASSPKDVRIVTSYNTEDIRTALFNAFHEGGKGLYEQDISEDLLGTLLAEVASFGVEEAEARLYENIIGRSRGFWEFYFDRLKEQVPSLAHMSLAEFYKAINKVKPSLIRMDADELTYVLHIIIRYEIEKDLINGRIGVEELPKVWNDKYRQYLGIEPDCDKNGVLQDIHWAAGYLGFFPSYLLANLYAAQFAHAMEQELGSLNGLMAQGRLEEIHRWLKARVHCHGALYTPAELIEKATGEGLSSRHYIEYLKRKYHEVYNLSQ